MEQEFQISRMSNEQISLLIPLYQAAFKRTYTEKYLAKKFDTSMFGKSNWGFVAKNENGEAIAFYAIFANVMHVDGKRITVAQSADTMTHPQYQGKGLFVTLAKKTFELALQDGCDLIFGFPNGNSLPGFVKKLNWINHANMLEFTIKINTIPVLPFLSKLGFGTQVFKKIVNQFLKPIALNELSKSNLIIDSQLNGQVRDEHFFKYKKYGKNFITSINGKQVWLKLDHRLIIGDIEKVNELELHQILYHLKKLCFAIGINKIIIQTTPNIYINSYLKTFPNIQVKDTIPFCYLNGTSIEVNKIGFTSLDWDTF